MSVHLEVERLRLALSRENTNFTEVQHICDAATGEINEALLSIVSNAVTQALDHALSIGADAFVDDIQILPNADGLHQISTHSGVMDYSRDSKEMLPALLKNAKVSKDGHRYKVIPIQKKDARVEHSMFSMMQSQQDSMDDARVALREQAGNRKLSITAALRDDLSKQAMAARTIASTPRTKSGEVEFRTASDRQDSSSAWVIPNKEMDMTEFVQELNQSISDSAHNTIASIVDSYYSSYAGTY